MEEKMFLEENPILKEIRSAIQSSLVEKSVEKLITALIKDAIGTELKTVISNYNKNHATHAIDVIGETPDEILRNIDIAAKYNLIKHDKVAPGKISFFLNSNGIPLSKQSIRDLVYEVRDVRNFCSHNKGETWLKSAIHGAEKVCVLRRFMSHFKLLYVDIYEEYCKAEAIILDQLFDFAKANNEDIDDYEDVFRHSGMIETDEFVSQLCDQEFLGSTREKVENIVFRALLENNIHTRKTRFAKSQTDIIRTYILANAEKFGLSSDEKENLQEVVEEVANEIKRQWLYANGYELSNQEILNILNINNVVLDCRYITNQKYLEFLEKKIIPFMDVDGRMFVTPKINEVNQTTYGTGNAEYDGFINNYGRRISAFSERNMGEAESLKNVIDEVQQYNFVVITMDKEFAARFDAEPFNGTVIVIDEVNEKSIQEEVRLKAQEPVQMQAQPQVQIQPQIQQQSQPQRDNSKTAPLFEKKKIDPYIEDEILKVSSEVSENTVLVDRNGNPIKMLEKLGEGGEGFIYSCSRDGLVAKIYKPASNTRNRKEKLELMSSRPVSHPGICWPVDTLYNGNGEFVGYLMPKVSGIDFDKMVSNTGNPMERRGWDRKKLVTCLINIMKMFDYLHKNNVIVGDINGANIMIESYDKVYLVDTDSFQIDKYPCKVEKQIYVDPTLKITDGEKQAYSIKEDRYKLAIIAYLMIMPGQMPYPINEGSAGGVFRFTEKGAKTTAKPVFNYIWSNMEKSVKKLFLRVFDNDERNVSAEEWIRCLTRYLDDIGDDPGRNKIKIDSYRGTGFEEDVKCSRCNGKLNLTKEVAKERLQKFGADRILCRDCSILDGIDRNRSVYMRCPGCKRVLTVSESYLESRRASGVTRITCNECGNGRGARPMYDVPRLSDVMLEMGD